MICQFKMDGINYECQSVLSANVFQPRLRIRIHLFNLIWIWILLSTSMRADPDRGHALHQIESTALVYRPSRAKFFEPQHLHCEHLRPWPAQCTVPFEPPLLTLTRIRILLEIMRIHIRNPGFSVSALVVLASKRITASPFTSVRVDLFSHNSKTNVVDPD
jgi:hypothetical protein